jgi:hypothetical protein
MITTGTKWFFGLGFVTLALAALYGWTTGGNGLGPVTAGYNGGVGDHLGYGILLGAAAISLFQGVVLIAWRDADPQAQAQLVRLDTVPPVRPAATSYWPPVAAFGAGLVVIGLVSEPIVFVAGLIVLGIVLVEWTVQTWADHATGDPAANRAIRNRLMNPIEFPVAGVLAVALIVLSFSRLFLAVSEHGAVWAAGILATVILAVGAVFAARPRLSANLVVGLLLIGAVAVLGIGIASGVAGEREFHRIGEEEHGEEGALPALPGPVPEALDTTDTLDTLDAHRTELA